MPLRRNVTAQISRLGHTATVLVRSETGSDQFNNTEYEWTADREIPCLRSYPNRNVEEERTSGTLEGDRPVFVFPKSVGPVRDVDDTERPLPPTSKDRINYLGTTYSLESRTDYDTHVEIMGNKIDN